ncbi:MAG: NfeD family protein [Pseudomonadota bacterium]|nr:NfeD family protein [Pseudomonadota bacterium]
MDILLHKLPETLMICGIAAIVIEVAVLSFSTFILFFFGAALLLTGLTINFGLLPEDFMTALLSVGGLTPLLALILWLPLKSVQHSLAQDSLYGAWLWRKFVLEKDVDSSGDSHYSSSGVNWRLKSYEPLNKGTLVEVTKVDHDVLWVRPLIPGG